MDVHVVDPKSSSKIVLRYEIKTEGGRKSKNQKEADDTLAWLGFEVNNVRVNLTKGMIYINGENAARHFSEVQRRLKQH